MSKINHILRGVGTNNTFAEPLIEPGPITIGRRATHQILLEEGTVSRDHAILTFRATNDDLGWYLTDQGSRHGTYINDNKLGSTETKKIMSGDILRFGQFELKYEQVANLKNNSILDSASITTNLLGEIKVVDFDCNQDLNSKSVQILGNSIVKIKNATTLEELQKLLIDSLLNMNAYFVSCVKEKSSGSFGILHTKSFKTATSSFVLSSELLNKSQRSDLKNAYFIEQYEDKTYSLCFSVRLKNSISFLIYANWKEEFKSDQKILISSFLGMIASISASYIEEKAVDRQRSEDEFKIYQGMINAIVAAIDAKDPYTQGHSKRVSMLARHLCIACDYDPAMIYHAELAGLVHDVGKIGVPESVLLKKGRLSEEEFEKIKTHPSAGARILSRISQMEAILPGVLEHHERFDGSGYPLGISGDTIHPLGRLIGICDAFDAMSSSRCYRNALPREYVLEELKKGKGAQFDPIMVEVFLTLDLKFYDEMIDRSESQSNKTMLG